MKIYSLCLPFLAAVTLSQAAELDNKPDVRQFDVAGVRLGMSLEEAQTALQAKYPNATFEKPYITGSPLNYEVKLPRELRMEDGNQRVNVYFSTNTLNGKSEEAVVSRIMYILPNTDENLVALQAAAKEKYGEPTLGKADSTLWRWCEKPQKVLSYECVAHKMPTLTLSKVMSVFLELSNPEYHQAEQEALEAAKNTKPNI